MQMTKLDGDRGWLDAPAAASVHRIDRQLGRLADVNDAGRSPEQANANRDAWEAYRDGRGPKAPYALGADESVHCRGLAVDSDDWYDPASAAVWRENGWTQTARYADDRDEPWHGEYSANLDQHITDPTPTPTPKELDVSIIYCSTDKEKTTRTTLAVGSLFWLLPNNAIVDGPVVWLSDVVLDALIEDARASKSRGMPPVLIHDTGSGKWLYAAHGGVVLLRDDEERQNIIGALRPATVRVGSDLAALMVTSIRQSRDG